MWLPIFSLPMGLIEVCINGPTYTRIMLSSQVLFAMYNLLSCDMMYMRLKYGVGLECFEATRIGEDLHKSQATREIKWCLGT